MIDAKQMTRVSGELVTEAVRAMSIYGSFNSYHEGYAVLLEEVDELWDEVKKKQPDIAKLRKEVIQVGAMTIRFVLDLIDENGG